MAVTVTTGKTHVRYARLLIQGNNLSGDSRSLGTVGLGGNPADVTGWVDIMENIPGMATVNFGDYSALFNNKVSAPGVNAGTHTALNAIGTDLFGTVAFGISEPPTIGAPSFSASLTQFTYLPNMTPSDAVAISATFNAGENAVAGWGQMLAIGVSESATIDLPSLDNGAAAPKGYMWIYHVAQSAGAMGTNDWDLTMEDSPADSVFSATLGVATNIGSAVTSAVITDPGSVDRYTRASLVKNAGTDLILWLAQIPL
jgi:hypothetical protein